MTNRWQDRGLLLARFLRNPRAVGAILPSSRPLAEAMIEHLPLDTGVRIAELGPGTGAFTGPLIERRGSTTGLLAVEIDPVFASALRQRWPSLDVACAQAEDLPALLDARGVTTLDHVISGLPFVSLPAPVADRTLASVASSLEPGGTFTTFQYLHCFGWPTAVAFRKKVSEVLGGSGVTSRLVVANMPPAYVLRWRLKGEKAKREKEEVKGRRPAAGDGVEPGGGSD
jgi:phospholipid N-methyltransferase